MRGHHSISEVMLCFHNINIVAQLVMSSALPGTQHFRPVNSRLLFIELTRITLKATPENNW